MDEEAELMDSAVKKRGQLRSKNTGLQWKNEVYPQ